MKIRFPYEKERSKIFGTIRRPIAQAAFWSRKYNRYLDFTLIIDTGADYTMLPHSKAGDLGIDLSRECVHFRTSGIGGSESVYLFPEIKMRLGGKEILTPIGFLRRDDIPPLLGRYKCLDVFSILFSNFSTTFAA